VKYLLVTIGSIGDLMPFLAVADALRQRGHTVVIASNAGYAALVSASGFQFSIVSDRPLQSLDDVLTRDPGGAWEKVRKDVLVPATGPVRDFIAHHAQNGPCKVVASWSAFGARLAQRELEIPLCTAYLSPHTVELDGPQAGDDIRIGFFPSWFGAAPPGDVHLAGFPLPDDAQIPALPPDVENFLQLGPAPIIFTPGSFMRRSGAFFAEAIKACEYLGMRGIFLTPYIDQLPSPLPATIRHFKFVSLQRLAPRCAAMVHHGGIGTCAQGLRAGIPQLVTPLFFDQPDNTARLKALGVADILLPDAFDGAAQMLSRLLSSSSVRENCQQMKAHFANQNPIGRICDLAERIAQ
jgi:UDP:flavonoid glycosyltransferase YjiC (YdhE family)